MTENENESPSSASDIAQWLYGKILEMAPRGYSQKSAVTYIRNTYGVTWSYRNQNGNWAINKSILDEFGKLKEKDPNIRWDSGRQSWSRVTDERLEGILQREARRKEALTARREGRA